MVRKRFLVVLFVVCLAAPSFAADRERGTREPRMGNEPLLGKIVRVVKKVIDTGDGITIAKPQTGPRAPVSECGDAVTALV